MCLLAPFKLALHQMLSMLQSPLAPIVTLDADAPPRRGPGRPLSATPSSTAGWGKMYAILYILSALAHADGAFFSVFSKASFSVMPQVIDEGKSRGTELAVENSSYATPPTPVIPKRSLAPLDASADDLSGSCTVNISSPNRDQNLNLSWNPYLRFGGGTNSLGLTGVPTVPIEQVTLPEEFDVPSPIHAFFANLHPFSSSHIKHRLSVSDSGPAHSQVTKDMNSAFTRVAMPGSLNQSYIVGHGSSEGSSKGPSDPGNPAMQQGVSQGIHDYLWYCPVHGFPHGPFWNPSCNSCTFNFSSVYLCL